MQMNDARSPFMVLASVSLGLLCSCATGNYIRSTLPPETFINRGAGRGDALLLTVCMESGEELTLGVDTGAPYTLLDSSLEPKLGGVLESQLFGGLEENSGRIISSAKTVPRQHSIADRPSDCDC